MSISEAEAKGSGFVSTINVMKDMTGSRFQAMVDALPEETRQLVMRPPLAVPDFS